MLWQLLLWVLFVGSAGTVLVKAALPVLPGPWDSRKHLMIYLGSGEMLRMLEHLDLGGYDKRTYVIGDDDPRSGERAMALEQEKLRDTDITGVAVVASVPRARHVGQSWISTLFTAALSLYHCFRLAMLDPNVCLRLTTTRLIYVESLARVRQLSLSGRILLRFVDRFVVQWPELCKLHPKIEYHGLLV